MKKYKIKIIAISLLLNFMFVAQAAGSEDDTADIPALIPLDTDIARTDIPALIPLSFGTKYGEILRELARANHGPVPETTDIDDTDFIPEPAFLDAREQFEVSAEDLLKEVPAIIPIDTIESLYFHTKKDNPFVIFNGFKCLLTFFRNHPEYPKYSKMFWHGLRLLKNHPDYKIVNRQLLKLTIKRSLEKDQANRKRRARERRAAQASKQPAVRALPYPNASLFADKKHN